MSHFSHRTRLFGMRGIHYTSLECKTAFAIRSASKAPMPIMAWNDLPSTLGAEWAAVNHCTPSAHVVADLLGLLYENHTSHFWERKAFPNGIRLSGSKSRSCPWWAVYLGVGCAPAVSANAVWSLSQHTWSGTRPQTEDVPLAMAQQLLHSGDLKENIELPLNSFIVD